MKIENKIKLEDREQNELGENEWNTMNLAYKRMRVTKSNESDNWQDERGKDDDRKED